MLTCTYAHVHAHTYMDAHVCLRVGIYVRGRKITLCLCVYGCVFSVSAKTNSTKRKKAPGPVLFSVEPWSGQWPAGCWSCLGTLAKSTHGTSMSHRILRMCSLLIPWSLWGRRGFFVLGAGTIGLFPSYSLLWLAVFSFLKATGLQHLV